MAAVKSCSPIVLDRLQRHVKENCVLSTANARYASKTFGALYEWVLCVLTINIGRPIIHFATSPKMIKILAKASNLEVDILDQVTFQCSNSRNIDVSSAWVI